LEIKCNSKCIQLLAECGVSYANLYSLLVEYSEDLEMVKIQNHDSPDISTEQS
jgi:hypothetical protein